jgi:hypothetical protein
LNPVAACSDYWTPRGVAGRKSRIPDGRFSVGRFGLHLPGGKFRPGIAVAISRMQRLARLFTGSHRIVEVPPEPKVLPPAAQRALAEAEQRHDGASFIDKYVSPSCK